MAPIIASDGTVASLVALAARAEYSITVPKASGRAYIVHTDDQKLWDEYVRADYDFCHMGESYRDRFDYVCGQWYLDEHKAIGVAFAVGIAMVAIVLLLFFWSTKRGQKRQRALLKRQGGRGNGKGVAGPAEELGQNTHLPLSQVDTTVVVLDGEKGGGGRRSKSAWKKLAHNSNNNPGAGGPSSETEYGSPSDGSDGHIGDFEYDEARTLRLTTVRTAPV